MFGLTFEAFWEDPTTKWTNQGHNAPGTVSVYPATPVLYTPSGSSGPPPSASWSLAAGRTAGEGLVNISGALARGATGGFRQGDYWNTSFPAPSGRQIKEAWVTLSALPTAAN